jgi:hypothetical protein
MKASEKNIRKNNDIFCILCPIESAAILGTWLPNRLNFSPCTSVR